MQSSTLVTVLYISHYNPEQEILRRFLFLPAVHGDDVIMSLVIIVFPLARFNYYIILTEYSSYVQK